MKRINFTILLGVCIGAIITTDAQYAEYGQVCSDTIKCISSDFRDPLHCDETSNPRVCRCPDNMFRHEKLNICVSPHGQKCTLESGDGGAHYTCTQFSQCWKDTTTVDARVDGKCHCDEDAKFDQDVTLQCKLTHGSTRCTNATDCDVMSALTCLDGTCVCQDQEDQTYDVISKTCRVLADGSCAERKPYPTPTCGPYMTCNAQKICECQDGFEKTPERTCGKKFNEGCESTSECHPQFVCEGDPKKCVCGTGQLYLKDKCQVQVGEACNITVTTENFECVPNAECVQEKCQCKDGYSANSNNGTCIAEHGSECSLDDGVPCNSYNFLDCTPHNNTCVCMTDYEFDDTRGKCRGLIGQNCRSNEQDGCIGNSICTGDKCGCGSKQTARRDNRGCLAVLDGDCNSETPCSSEHFVACRESICQCADPEEQLPDVENSRCVAKAGAPCGNSADEISCFDNSTCSGDDTRRCVCNSGLVGNGDGICINEQNNLGSALFSSGYLLTFIMSLLILGTI